MCQRKKTILQMCKKTTEDMRSNIMNTKRHAVYTLRSAVSFHMYKKAKKNNRN